MSVSISNKKPSGTSSTRRRRSPNCPQSSTAAPTGSNLAGNSHEPSDEHCQAAATYITDETNYHHDLLHDLFEVVRSVAPDHAHILLEMIRSYASVQEVRAYLASVLMGTQALDKGRHALNRLEVFQSGRDVRSEAPQFRPKIMDIHYLCDSAPYKVPAKPWTTVTDDDQLVSHLVSLYLTWDYPFYAFFDSKTFIKHMSTGNVNSDFCSPFLVNALLASACHYSHYSEAYTIPGDVRTKGADFLAEAERYMRTHQFERGSGVRLASLQATLLLYERYSMSGNDDFGYTMLHRAIEMAESLGIVNNTKRNFGSWQMSMSEDMMSSIKRTAWGLFQVDTIVHTSFLKKSHVNAVNVDRIDRDETGPREMWTPYPIQCENRPSQLSQYFDEACNLSYISRDISQSLSRAQEPDVIQCDGKQGLFNRLRDWGKRLPRSFLTSEKPVMHIILLRMRFHTLVIILCCDGLDVQPSPSQLYERRPKQRIPGTKFVDEEISLASAREIAGLAQLQRMEFGMERAHQFAMYAINLALFTFLQQQAFDILDEDFLSLTSSFSIIACRSRVGRNLFHLFKLSVRAQNQGERLQRSEHIPLGIKELFRPDYQSQVLDKWDHYAEGLARVDGEASYLEEYRSDSETAVPSGLPEMLEKYERLSVGKEERRGGQLDNAFWGA